ncbi:MAG: hypothetical protein AXA67_00320 [Methylothermaceae bacteria B42]|nr:MAG: hypothetical protein AXA67_00320 [Methylothermaceae bacteria B42]HHJ38840.1 hypothetical protein [Methylothermaceae bacterium]
MDESLIPLACLAGDKQTLKTLPEDSPLCQHLPHAQEALAAYCRGDDKAMTAVLKQIPFRSPYKDLRWLLSALTCYPADPGKGRELLNKIPPDSPFACPAQAGMALFQPPTEKQTLSVAARTFLAAIRGKGEQVKPKHLFAKLLSEAKKTRDPTLVKAVKDFLAWYPQGMTACEKAFGPLTETEKLRIQALHLERSAYPDQIYNAWIDLGKTYDRQGDLARAAAVCRHLVQLVETEFGPGDPELEIVLNNLVSLAPQDRDAWLKLAAFYHYMEDEKARGRCLDDALRHLPEDPGILKAAAEAAIDRGAFKKAAQLTKKLLKIDPINQQARRRLIRAHLNHARKQLKGAKYDLARKELEAAKALAKEPLEQAEVLVAQGYLESFANLMETGERWFDEACNLLPVPLGEWLVAAEALRCQLPGKDCKRQLKKLRLILDTAVLQMNKSVVLEMLALAKQLKREEIDPTPLLQAGNAYLKKACELDWTLAELEKVCDLLLELERYQLVRDYVRKSPLWKQRTPSLVYFDVAAKCRGVAGNLNLADVENLENALENADKEKLNKWSGRILGLLEDYDRSRSPFPSPLGQMAEIDAEVEKIARETGLPPQEIMAQMIDMLLGGRKK